MKSKRVAFKWLPVAVAALPLCALVYYYTTHRRPVDNAKTATSTSTSVTTTTAEQRRSRSTAEQQQQSSRISLTYTHVHPWVRSLLYLSLSCCYSLLSLSLRSLNQPNVSMLRTCLVSLASYTTTITAVVVTIRFFFFL